MLFLGSVPKESVVFFEAFQPVAPFGVFLCLCHPCAVTCKREKVAFSRKANRVDRSDQVSMYGQVLAFRSTLRLAVVDIGRFGTLTVVIDVHIRIICVRDV